MPTRKSGVCNANEFDRTGKDAVTRKDDNLPIIEPAPPQSLAALLASWQPLDEVFAEIEDLPPEPVNI